EAGWSGRTSGGCPVGGVDRGWPSGVTAWVSGAVGRARPAGFGSGRAEAWTGPAGSLGVAGTGGDGGWAAHGQGAGQPNSRLNTNTVSSADRAITHPPLHRASYGTSAGRPS